MIAKGKYILGFMFLGILCNAQLPKTDVYLADLKNINLKPQILSIKYLNHFNPNGYNNQARFFSYDDVYISVAKDTNQITDIYHLNVKSEEITQVTNTEKISEFSPIPTPSGTDFSVIRIENDGVTQTLWLYPLDRSNIGKRLLPTLKNIGYHTWIAKDSVALFLVGSPHALAISNIVSGKTEIIVDNIGRCIKMNVDGDLLFVHKIRPDLWLLKMYNIKDKAISTLCQMPQNTEDFEVLPNGIVITGVGPKLKTFNVKKDTDWVEIADLSSLNIMNINRLNLSRDRLLFINNK